MSLTAGRLLRLGAVAGAAGGVVSAVTLAALGEGAIGRAVRLEGPSGEPEMFSRGTQQLGGALAVVIVGAVMGVVFALVYGYVRPRLRTPDDWRASYQLAAAAFVTVFVVPFLRYPPNPPAVGDPDTITRRTVLYLLAIAWSLVATWATARAWRNLRDRPVERQLAVLATAGLYVWLVGLGLLLLPPNSDAVTPSASLIWQFRLATLAGSAALWSVTGAAFGWLVARPLSAPFPVAADGLPVSVPS
jgi:predicted cobalt transporter CbtA